MIRKKRPRRILAGTFVVLGVVLMVLAPESPGGVALLIAGVVVELIGIVLERSG